jgi:predicted TIM-barrel fold metal-dependent hydrolase
MAWTDQTAASGGGAGLPLHTTPEGDCMYKLFSVDDHIIEHARVWTDRLPAKHRELGPRVIEEGGRQHWLYEGDKRWSCMGISAVAGKPPEFWDKDAASFADMIPGCYDPKQRVKDFLADGILATVCFPQFARFGGSKFLEFRDKELALLCARAYNDFVIDEWCASGPEGFYVPMGICMLWDVAESVREIHRNAARGFRALAFVENPVPLGLPSFFTDHWDPIFRACEETDTVVCMHIGSAVDSPIPSPDGPMTVQIALGAVGTQISAVNLLMSPVCRRFPKLKIMLSEGGIGWIPAMLERADRQFQRHRLWTKMDEITPTEIFKRNIFTCMIYEPICFRELRHVIGIDKIVWECDYPHADTPWPASQREVAEVMQGIPQDEIEAVTFRNAERVFRWKMADPKLAEPYLKKLAA